VLVVQIRLKPDPTIGSQVRLKADSPILRGGGCSLFEYSQPTMPPASLPTATYRLQFHAGFTFADAEAITGYLAALGVSHVYASSYLRAVPGSPHGYDVADPTQLNPEIGDEPAYEAWIASLRAHGMGHIIDVVPNHMGIARSANPWWQDVLENGEASLHARVFDIDWHPIKPELEHRVLLPVLGDVYGAVLERQEIRVGYRDGAFEAHYFDSVFPIAPGTYNAILELVEPGVIADTGDSSDAAIELLSILTAVRRLPGRHGLSDEQKLERRREKEVIKRRLAALVAASPDVRTHMERAIETLNGDPGRPDSFDRLDALLSRQAYRLAYWRVAGEEINYRRFFDINELAAIRMEDPEVFEQVHGFAFQLVARGAVDGFRIDHVDGLYDPGDYLGRVQARAREVRGGVATSESRFFVVVEKILGRDERLPEWPVEGTTGYDFMVRLNALFVDGRNEKAMTRAYQRFTRFREPFHEIAYRGKQLVLRVSMASELSVLAHQLNRFSERHRHYRDFTLNSLGQAIREIIACFPVYRTYVNEREPGISARDRVYLERAVGEARRRNINRPHAVYDFVADVLLRRIGYVSEAEQPEHLRFIGKFQQVTSPVTAKGIEDTALYIYNRLVSLNEVGGEPDHFSTPPAAVHGWLEERARQWPHGLSPTSTHDTKRSEDVRARLSVLSEMPAAWAQAAGRWARANRRSRSTVDGQSFPSRNDEYLFYQAVLGSWPLAPMDAAQEREYTARLVAYMEKAIREAKVYTSWVNPSERHERAMTRFVELALAPDNRAFRDDFLAFWRPVARHGVWNSLSQLALKVGAPGVPDFYQGTELWDFSLVDPDNRRPVDYARRRALLAEVDAALAGGCESRRRLAAQLMGDPADDRLKLLVTSELLRFRRSRREVFDEGEYLPLRAAGSRTEHLFAFARRAGARLAIVAVPRLVVTLAPGGSAPVGESVWGDTLLPTAGHAGPFRDVLTGTTIQVVAWAGGPHVRAAELFGVLPVAVIEGQ
jgi:(1->4)-alpha-D-glucan 1-alpha-D-glucosylmutase